MEKIKVFIVDDDQDFAESMAEIFEMRGYDVSIAFTGEEAIRIFHEKDFDVTFMDVKLPGKNGVESFFEIRKLNPNARVVMMTGYSVEQLLDQAVEKGACAVLYKPLDIEQVLELVRKITNSGMILVADNDPDFIEGVKELLEKNAYTVCIAHNGKEAIDRVLSNGIDVLILDLRLPILNGLEVYLELKKSSKIVPTIIVTAFSKEETEELDIVQSMSEIGILSKPFDPKDLLNVVDNMIKKKIT